LVVPAVAAVITLGLVLHANQEFPKYSYPQIANGGSVYIDYNERIRERALVRWPGHADVIVLGNSFGRDAANVLLEADPTPRSGGPARRIAVDHPFSRRIMVSAA